MCLAISRIFTTVYLDWQLVFTTVYLDWQLENVRCATHAVDLLYQPILFQKARGESTEQS